MEGLRFDACRAACKAERTSDGTDVCRPCDGNPERDSENKTYRERNSRFRKFLHDLPTWLTQSEHLKLQNVTKGVQRLDRKLAVLERPMGKDDPRRVWSGFVAQPVNVFQSSQSCPWPKATKHRDIFPRLVQSGAKSCSWRSARPAGTFSTHPARPLVAPAFQRPPRGDVGVLRTARRGPAGARDSSSRFERNHCSTGDDVMVGAGKHGDSSMPSRERHVLKQRTADRRSKHASTHIIGNA